LLLQLRAGCDRLALQHDRARLALLLLAAKHHLLGPLLLHHHHVALLLLLLLQDVLHTHWVLQLDDLLHALWPERLLKLRCSGADRRHAHWPLSWLCCEHVGLLELHALCVAQHTWPHRLRLLRHALHHLHGCWLTCDGDGPVLCALCHLGQQLVQGLEAADWDRFKCLDGCGLCHATHKQVLGQPAC
jgi:hypothetical protein